MYICPFSFYCTHKVLYLYQYFMTTISECFSTVSNGCMLSHWKWLTFYILKCLLYTDDYLLFVHVLYMLLCDDRVSCKTACGWWVILYKYVLIKKKNVSLQISVTNCVPLRGYTKIRQNKTKGWLYLRVSNTNRIKFQNLNVPRLVLQLFVFVQSIKAGCWVENEDVVGTATAGEAPTTSEWSIIYCLLRCDLYQRFDGASDALCALPDRNSVRQWTT